MKKLTLFIIIFAFIGVAFWAFKENNFFQDNSVEEIDTVFLTAENILGSDFVVQINNNDFDPNTVNIKKGERVVFLNNSVKYSWPASDPHPTHSNFPEFDPELPMKQGEAWAYVFNETGSFLYHDHLDPSKRGIINVSI